MEYRYNEGAVGLQPLHFYAVASLPVLDDRTVGHECVNIGPTIQN